MPSPSVTTLLSGWLMSGLLVVAGSSQAQVVAPRVVHDPTPLFADNGMDGLAKPRQGDYPFVVSLQWRDVPGQHSAHFCAGSLLSPVVVMTAAHCVATLVRTKDDGTRLTLVIDRADLRDDLHGIERHPLRRDDGSARIFLHPRFPEGGAYDVAVIQLDEPVMVDVRPRLPAEGATVSSADWMVAGWPPVSPELWRASAVLLDAEPCQQAYGTGFHPGIQLCVDAGAGLDPCVGGAGSPLFRWRRGERRPLQAGMVSRGGECAPIEGPQVHVNLADPDIRVFLSRFVPLF